MMDIHTYNVVHLTTLWGTLLVNGQEAGIYGDDDTA
jgi:hypothetical protein